MSIILTWCCTVLLQNPVYVKNVSLGSCDVGAEVASWPADAVVYLKIGLHVVSTTS